ncbi:hypothetical protein ACJIZ3_024972 [Penstemon smallii]|uniref:Uncharacterized protein n=1 Tax=Penstemon smallii TaxID=265156 RepID=A0ABD3TTG5_9LAMI
MKGHNQITITNKLHLHTIYYIIIIILYLPFTYEKTQGSLFSMMSIFYQEEPPNNLSKRCKYLIIASTLKDAFSKCHSFSEKLSVLSHEEKEEGETSTDIVEEEEVFVSAVISKYMESKSKRKFTFANDGLYWALSPLTAAGPKKQEDGGEEFFSVGSRLSRCSSASSFEAFVSVKTRFSRCSSLNNIDFPKDFGRKRSIIVEFCHYEGWPFGLGRKAFLPPLPKSPSDSWSWRKKTIKINA